MAGAVQCDDGVRTMRRTTDQPVARIKAHRPRKIEPAGAETQTDGATQ